MFLSTLRIENFKNYEKAALRFGEGINCLTGPNGSGKTNILDAIYNLCTGKSYFNPADAQLIYENADYFSLRGDFTEGEETDDIMCVLVKGRRKVIKKNEEAYSRLIDHYGEYPVVMIAPGDLELIMGGSEERRKWMDSAISWTDHNYLQQLLKYERIVQQRNAALRNMENAGQEQARILLKVYDEMMIPIADDIHAVRKQFITDFQPYFEENYRLISGEKEQVSLAYTSGMLHEALAVLLEQNIRKDLALQRTNAGPHRDDLEFLIAGNPMKRYGSQGQQKTFLLALKLAQLQYLHATKHKMPILLLDDVCERLDEHRLAVLFRLIQNRERFGQVFVTDTSAEWIKTLLDTHTQARMYIVNHGEISEA